MSVRLGIIHPGCAEGAEFSSRRNSLLRHVLNEALEQVVAVLRAGRGLRVVLHREDGLGPSGGSLRCSRRTARRASPRHPSGSASGTTTKPWFWLVISTLPVCRSFTGWLAPRWPRRHFFRAWRPRPGQHLVAEADAEDRRAGIDHFADHRHGIDAGGRRIAGTVGEEHAVGLVAQHVLGAWRSPAPRSRRSRRRRGSAGCCAWRRNRWRRRLKLRARLACRSRGRVPSASRPT